MAAPKNTAARSASAGKRDEYLWDPVREAVRSGTIAPAYLLFGPEELLKREALAVVIEAALAGGPRELNETRLMWKETNAAAVVDLLSTFPMFGERRVVVVKGLDAAKSEQLEPLIAYLERPSPRATLVLEATAVDLRTKLAGAFKKLGTLVKFAPLYANQLPGFVGRRMRERGATIDGQAADLLAETIGADLAALDEAMERLILYVSEPGSGRAPHVRIADVETVVAKTRVHTIFELADALGHRNAKGALGILRGMLDNREQPIAIAAMVARHFRRLWQASDLARQGHAQDEIGRELGMHQFFLGDFLRQAKLFSDADFARLLDRMYQVDRSLKSSSVEPDLHLVSLVLEVCGAGR